MRPLAAFAPIALLALVFPSVAALSADAPFRLKELPSDAALVKGPTHVVEASGYRFMRFEGKERAYWLTGDGCALEQPGKCSVVQARNQFGTYVTASTLLLSGVVNQLEGRTDTIRFDRLDYGLAEFPAPAETEVAIEGVRYLRFRSGEDAYWVTGPECGQKTAAKCLRASVRVRVAGVSYDVFVPATTETITEVDVALRAHGARALAGEGEARQTSEAAAPKQVAPPVERLADPRPRGAEGQGAGR